MVLVKIIMAVETPAYGLNTPDGIEIMASKLLLFHNLLTQIFMRFRWTVITPIRHTAARPPSRIKRKNKAKNNNSVFFGFYNRM